MAALFFTVVGLSFYAAGLFAADTELQQWSTIALLAAYVFLLGERDARRGLIVGPNQESEAIQMIIRIVSNSEGFLRIIDPYPSDRILALLTLTPKGIPVQFLTSTLNISKEDIRRFEHSARETMGVKPELEIRYDSKGRLHARYLLTKPFGWSVDYSIKNAGKKETRFSDLGTDETRMMVARFDQYWEQSTPLPLKDD